MSRPSFQFYHQDWFGNVKLRLCSKELKGHWIDTLCLMADSDEFGIVRASLKEIAEAIGGKAACMRTLADKQIIKGADAGETCAAYIYTPKSGRKPGPPVVLIPEQPGPIWYSSKMVRDEYVRQNAGKSTRFGHSPSRRQGEDEDASSHSPSRRDGADQSDGSPSPSPTPPPVKTSDTDTRARAARRGEITARLRSEGVLVSSAYLVAWADELNVTDAQLQEAVDRCRNAKPAPEQIHAKYFDTTLRRYLEEAAKPKAPVPVRRAQPEQDFSKLDYSKGF